MAFWPGAAEVGYSRAIRLAARSRAVHQFLDRPRLYDDPVAIMVLSEEDAKAVRTSPDRFNSSFSRHVRAFLVARTLIAEESLGAAVQDGVCQYVILGAGLDTFAHRNPYPASKLRVFEVDRPVVQSWKRQRLQAAGIVEPSELTYVPMDFEKQDLIEELVAAGMDRDASVFVSWLGVSMYLSRRGVMSSLRRVAECRRGSRIVFDYAEPFRRKGLRRKLIYWWRRHRFSLGGEPWRTRLGTGALVSEMTAMGFVATDPFDAQRINDRFFSDRQDGLTVRGPMRVMCARV